MTITITLDEKDLREAVALWAEKRGMRTKGDITVNHYPGDLRESPSTTISVQAEPIASKP